MGTTQLTAALTKTARKLFESEYPKIAPKVCLEVRYFGHGQRFQVRRLPNGNLEAVIFFHEDSDVEFTALIDSVASAAHKLLERRVTIRAELLRQLISVAGDAINGDDRLELMDLLSD